jgi:hypothetical protein
MVLIVRHVVFVIQTAMKQFVDRQKEKKRMELQRQMEIQEYFFKKAVMIQKMYADNNVDGEDINQENRATF